MEEKEEIIEYAKGLGVNISDIKYFDGDSDILRKEIKQYQI